jgi:HPt (histidine-containing phosphotransfer) domain-containing protein
MKEELDRCLEVGMNDYITKPFRKEALQQKLDLWLQEEGDGDDGATGDRRREASADTHPQDRTEPVLDGKKLSELRQLGEALGQDVLRDLAETFRSQTCLEEMRSGLARGDRPLVGQQAHSLRGSSAALGALRLAALCEELEQLPSEACPEACAGRVAAIEEEYERVLSGLVAAAAEG